MKNKRLKKKSRGKELLKRKLENNLYRARYFLKSKISINKANKNFYKRSYDLLNKNEIGELRPYNEDNSLNKDNYFNLTDIVIMEIVSKEDISYVKRGMDRLIKRNLSHKFWGISTQNERIHDSLDRFDDMIADGKSWSKTTIFDFENNSELRKKIEYFEIDFRNLSSSYMVMEIRLHISDDNKTEIQQLIKENYEEKEISISKHYVQNKKSTGAILGVGVNYGPDSSTLKNKRLKQEIYNLKLEALEYIGKFIPLFFYKHNHMPTSLNIFDTDFELIDLDNVSKPFIHSMGIDLNYGFLIRNEIMLFNNTGFGLHTQKEEMDYIILLNSSAVSSEDAKSIGFSSKYNYLYHNLKDYIFYLYVIFILNDVGEYYEDNISSYRNRINECKMDKKALQKLLKIKYEFERDFYLLNKLKEELSFENEFISCAEKLNNDCIENTNYKSFINPQKHFVTSTKNRLAKIENNADEIERSLNLKIQLSTSINEYDNVKFGNTIQVSGLIVSVFALVISGLTLYLVIFENQIGMFKSIFESLFNTVLNLFHGYIK